MVLETRDYKNILLNRIKLLDLCEKNPNARANALQRCKEDKVFWYDNFCFTFDPRTIPSAKPFILYPKQKEFILWLDSLLVKSRQEEKINAVIEKPRTVGFSFTFMAWCLWYWLFDEFVARIGSWKEEYVDKKGDPDALFFKFDYLLKNLPLWMQPPDWQKARMNLIAVNPKNDNAISGETANPNFGRGGRRTVILLDEFGFWSWARSSWESCGESTNFRIAGSTHSEMGRDSHFYKLLVGKKGRIQKFAFDWTDVPGRDEKWLAEQKATKSPEEFQREIMKSVEGSEEGKVYLSSFALADFSECDYNPRLPLFTVWDFGLDEVAMLWIQKDFSTDWLYIIDAYNNSNKTVDFYVPFVNGLVKEEADYTYTEYDLKIIERHKQWKKAIHFGDPDVAKRSFILQKQGKPVSTKEILQENNIYIQTTRRTKFEHHQIRDKVRLSFRRLEVNEVRCEYFIECMRNASYPQVSAGQQRTTEILKPIHNWTSHFRTAYEFFIDNEPKSHYIERKEDMIEDSETYNPFEII